MPVDDRDRNAWGRPENARPRDRLGRPLPHDTDQEQLAEQFSYDTVEEALATAVELWDQERFFEAHECLEDVWHHAPDEDRSFWQGVIQVAITCCHHQRGNDAGCLAMAAKAKANLADAARTHHGIDVERLRAFLDDALAGRVSHPRFPATDGGPWFRAEGATTPLVRVPPWQAAAEQRANQAQDVS